MRRAQAYNPFPPLIQIFCSIVPISSLIDISSVAASKTESDLDNSFTTSVLKAAQRTGSPHNSNCYPDINHLAALYRVRQITFFWKMLQKKTTEYFLKFLFYLKLQSFR